MLQTSQKGPLLRGLWVIWASTQLLIHSALSDNTYFWDTHYVFLVLRNCKKKKRAHTQARLVPFPFFFYLRASFSVM